MEIWDLYDQNRNLTGETAVRGNPLPEGRYHLVVEALFLNSKGETLLQRRAKEKDIMPDIWSVVGGSATTGEDSIVACVRENEEEMGFTPDTAQARLFFTERVERKNRNFFRDVWLFYQDMPIEKMTWQPGEVQDGMWILPEKIKEDETLWHDVNELYFWGKVYPYLCLESMRVRIPKGVYRHYKGNRYEVKGLALHSETLEPMVIYQALYGMGETWTRSASMWNEEVTLPDGKKVSRFQYESL